MDNFDWVRISRLIAHKRAGSITVSEQEELNEWLAASGKHRQVYDKMLAGEMFAGRERPAGKFDVDSAKERISAAIKRRLRRRRRALIGSLTAASAAAAYIIILSFGGDNKIMYENTVPGIAADHVTLAMDDGRSVILEPSETGDEWMEYVKTDGQPNEAAAGATVMRVTVPRGQEYKLLMPDSSYVWLNSETTIEYPSVFADDRRAVTLRGEAFFDIAHDASRPFEISTPGNLRITVLGTRFNVNSYTDVEQTSVSLVAGSVVVAHEDNAVVLSPNQQAVFNRKDNALHKRDIPDAAVYAAWTNGMFNFENESIGVILNAMEKWYNITFDTGGLDMEPFGHFTLSAPRSNDFKYISDILCKITGLQFHREGGTVYLSY